MKGLEGIKVVDLTGYVFAAATTRILGELGATVWKIEAFTGDEFRKNGPAYGMPKTEIDDPAFDFCDTNKEFLSINLKDPAGMEILHKLLAEADIMVTSFRTKALERLGLDYETLHAQYPGLVWAQSRGYGEYGPMKDEKGFDAVSFAARGGYFMSQPQANEHFEPTNWLQGLGDLSSGVSLAVGILAALVRKDRTGQGDKVTVNLYHQACYGQVVGLGQTQFGDHYPKSRMDAACPTNNSYMSKDGIWFYICYGVYDLYVDRVAKALGVEWMLDDPTLNNAEAINNPDNPTRRRVCEIFQEAAESQDFAYWKERFIEFDIPYAELWTMEQTLQDEEIYISDCVRKLHYDQYGDIAIATTPIRMESLGDPAITRSRPIGYDTRRVMKAFGYSDSDVDGLVEGGAVKCYEGPELSDSVLEPSYGNRSKGKPYYDGAVRRYEDYTA